MIVTLDEARAVKAKVAALLQGDPTVNGVGIARLGSGYAVKVNRSESTAAAQLLPDEIDGVPIHVETVGTIHKQREA